ncbi:MAG TPA: glycosyltransferase [Chloroflexia bacterium]|nr:glycosyltransferase [Chloroflexia bacterium]
MQTTEAAPPVPPVTHDEKALRILMLTSSYPKFPGDVTAPFIEAIAQFSQARGHQVSVVLPYHPDLKRDKVEKGVRFYPFKYTFKRNWNIWGYAASMEADVKVRKLIYFLLPFVLLSSFLKLWRLTAREQFDLIQAHWVIPNAPVAVLVGKLRRLPVVISLHGSDVYLAESLRPVGWVARWAFRHAQGVTASSPDLLERAQRLGASTDPERAAVIPYGVDPTVFKKPERSGEQLRSDLKIAPDEKILFCVGRLVYKKGFEYAIQALPAVLAKYPRTTLVIAGMGDLLEPLQKLAKETGVSERVRFEGAVAHNRIPDYLAACDLFLLPSVVDRNGNVDGLPNTLLEALAAGRPVIASNVAGVPLAIKDGVNGRLVPQRDEVALAEAIIDLLSNPDLRQRFGAAARRKVEEELNWKAVVSRYSQVFEVAAGHPF